jgi:hypothetical protein
MASAIKEDYFTGGAGMAPTGTDFHPPLAQALRDGIDDITDLRTKLLAVCTMLDAEAGLGGGYVAAGTPAAQALTKG